jgi:hypothetical protein
MTPVPMTTAFSIANAPLPGAFTGVLTRRLLSLFA